MRVLQGTGVSPGVNAGKPINIERTLDFSIAATISLDEGIKELTAKYKSIIEKYNSSSREIEAEVLEAYILILNDPELINSLSELNEANLEKFMMYFWNNQKYLNKWMMSIFNKDQRILKQSVKN